MLTIYRRHTDNCRKALLTNGLTEDQITLYRDCDCIIWIRGQHGTRYVRESLATRSWREAVTLASRAEADTTGDDITVASAFSKYLDICAKRDLRAGTLRNYGSVLGHFQEWLTEHGVTAIRLVRPEHIDDFINRNGSLSSTRSTNRGVINAFFVTALRREWVQRNPVSALEPITITRSQTQPYTQGEVGALLAALPRAAIGMALDGGRAAGLFRLMLETGLRLGDAIGGYRPKTAEEFDGVWVSTFVMEKAARRGQTVTVFVPATLQRDIMALQWLSDDLPFTRHTHATAKDKRDACTILRNAAKAAGVENAHSHRFRDTFAVNALLGDVQLDDVSKMLGHSSVSMTERHYAPWVKARRDRLARIASRMHGKASLNVG
jgi:integrase/recombinase XerD